MISGMLISQHAKLQPSNAIHISMATIFAKRSISTISHFDSDMEGLQFNSFIPLLSQKQFSNSMAKFKGHCVTLTLAQFIPDVLKNKSIITKCALHGRWCISSYSRVSWNWRGFISCHVECHTLTLVNSSQLSQYGCGIYSAPMHDPGWLLALTWFLFGPGVHFTKSF